MTKRWWKNSHVTLTLQEGTKNFFEQIWKRCRSSRGKSLFTFRCLTKFFSCLLSVYCEDWGLVWIYKTVEMDWQKVGYSWSVERGGFLIWKDVTVAFLVFQPDIRDDYLPGEIEHTCQFSEANQLEYWGVRLNSFFVHYGWILQNDWMNCCEPADRAIQAAEFVLSLAIRHSAPSKQLLWAGRIARKQL